MLIIFEGVSRTGKDTHIRKLLEFLNEYRIEREVFHFQKPPRDNIQSQFEVFVKHFSYANKELIEDKKRKVIFWNRSHLGEGVYGKLYRNWYYDYIWELEKIYSELMNKSILFLMIDKAENVINRDDGKSFSTKIEDKNNELKQFYHIFDKSIIQKKHIIYVSKTIEEVHKTISQFIMKEFNNELQC